MRRLVAFLFAALIAMLPLALPASAQADRAPRFNALIQTLVVSPSTSRLYALVEQTGPWSDGVPRNRWLLFQSGDGGHTWAEYPLRGLDQTGVLRGLTMDYRAQPDTLFVIGEALGSADSGSRLYRSRAGGDWEQIGASPGHITTVAVDFLDSSILYAGLDDFLTGGISRSLDGGLTWAHFDLDAPPPGPSVTGLPRRPVVQILVDPIDPTTLYAFTAHQYRYYDPVLLRGTRDGHWTELPLPAVPAGGQGIWGIAFDAAAGTLLAGSYAWGGGAPRPDPTARTLWHSPNPRESDPSRVRWVLTHAWDFGTWGWFADIPSVLPLAVDAGVDHALYAQTHGADAALLKSHDDGLTWEPLIIPRLQGDLVPGGGGEAWTAPSGHVVSGEWLRFLKEHGDVDNLGYPRTGVIADPVAGGQVVQYFQRAALEWHPEAPLEFRIQRRLLADALDPGADPPLSPAAFFELTVEGATCFPLGPGIGLGHCVSDLAPNDTPVFFREYFDSHGGVGAFGFPREEPNVRDGRWTQRFQAAVFEYHVENDVDGPAPGSDIPLRNWRVQLELLGDRYIELWQLPYR